MNPASRINDFRHGVNAALPIAVGYIPIALTFGIIARQSGIPLSHTILMSLLVYAGASQFMAVNMMIAGNRAMEIIIAALILNFRHFVLSMALMNSLGKGSKLGKAGLAFGITDETFAVIALKQTAAGLSQSFVFGLQVTAYGSWLLGTWIGGLFARIIPPGISQGMAIALYAMFIGLLVPALKNSLRVGVIVALSMTISTLWEHFLPGKGAIIMATILSSLLGAIIFKKETKAA